MNRNSTQTASKPKSLPILFHALGIQFVKRMGVQMTDSSVKS